jgi:hypothetical protein
MGSLRIDFKLFIRRKSGGRADESKVDAVIGYPFSADVSLILGYVDSLHTVFDAVGGLFVFDDNRQALGLIKNCWNQKQADCPARLGLGVKSELSTMSSAIHK